MEKIHMIGQRFGRLVVERYAGIKRRGKTNEANKLWQCKCDCGKLTFATTGDLRSGGRKSCGCLKKQGTTTTHGKSGTRLYRIYAGMKQRCYNPRSPKYPHYGGRGITICKEWLNDFMSFYNWSMSHGYADNLSIDRIDVNGNYEPSNCRWTTSKVQGNNTRVNHKVHFKGEIYTIAELSELLGIKYHVLQKRVIQGLTDDALLESISKFHKQ
ncbi:MAG: hypothetical protein Q4G33_11625 [bacterium]|nr:hypothetical protein [bacterium]